MPSFCELSLDETAVFGVFCRRFGGPMPNGCTVRLPRLIGEGRALDMMMTGRPVAADEAMAMGLADRLAPRGETRAAAEELARELANFPQTAMLSDRASVIRQWDYPEKEAIRLEIEGSRPAFEQDFQSGAGRFVGGAGRHGVFEDGDR